MEEEILADFFDWKGKHSLIRLSVLVIKRKYRTNGRHVWRCHFRQSSLADFLIYRQ